MAHIAIDARAINSGTGDYIKHLLYNLEQIDTNNRYSVLVPTKDIEYWKPSNPNFTVEVADFSNYSINEQLGFKYYLDKLSPDLVHFCMPQQPLLYRGKRVTTMHDMTLLNTYNSDKNWLVFHFKQYIGRFVWKHLAKLSNHIIAISENTKQEYQDFSRVPNNKISVIYEAVASDVNRHTEPYGELPFDKFIMHVGQQPDYKNVRRLAEAHQLLLDKYPDLGLVFVGRLGDDTLNNKRLYEKHGYKNIHFTGFIDDKHRDWLFSQAKAYVFPSLMEGFGLSPLIAMDYGTPVISSNTSCMPEILGDAAIYFNPYSVDDIAKKIDEVISDQKLSQSMIKLGKEQVKKYSWKKTAKETHAIYLKVLSED